MTFPPWAAAAECLSATSAALLYIIVSGLPGCANSEPFCR